MKRAIKDIVAIGGIAAATWWIGGLLYFILVTKHFRDGEKLEEVISDANAHLSGMGIVSSNPNRDAPAFRRRSLPLTKSATPPRPIPEPRHFQQQPTRRNPWRV
jgi:hypothetical protein